jgi:hypothetical protein
MTITNLNPVLLGAKRKESGPYIEFTGTHAQADKLSDFLEDNFQSYTLKVTVPDRIIPETPKKKKGQQKPCKSKVD